MVKPIGKKEAIEQAAIELFACKGLAGATVKDIALKAGVTEGALYRHYPSKEDMASALFVRELAALRLSLIEVIESDAPFTSKLRTLVERLYAEYARQPYSLVFIMLNFQNLQGIDLPGETANIYDFIIERTGQLLGGLPLPPSDITPTLLTGVIMQPVLFHHHGKLPGRPLDYVDQVATACNRLLGIAEEQS